MPIATSNEQRRIDVSERDDDLIAELQYIADTISEMNPAQRLEAQMLLCVRNYLVSDAATVEKFDWRSASVEPIVRFVCRITKPRIPTMEEERAKKTWTGRT